MKRKQIVLQSYLFKTKQDAESVRKYIAKGHYIVRKVKGGYRGTVTT